MDEWFWFMMFIVFMGVIGSQARQRDNELLKHIPKKKREEIIKQRTKAQEKANKDMWVVLKWIGIGIFAFIVFMIFLIFGSS